MILRSTPPSPFARKVNIAASVLGLTGQISIEAADLSSATDSVRRQNPLGKIPTLVLEDGSTLFDSRVILEYLDHRAGGGKIIPQRAEGAVCRAAPAGARRRHDRRADPDRLRRPLAAGRASRPEMDRLPGRQDQARPDRARSRSAVARSDPERRPDRARLLPRPPRSALRRRLAGGASQAWSPGSTASPRKCRPSSRPRWRPDSSQRAAASARLRAAPRLAMLPAPCHRFAT